MKVLGALLLGLFIGLFSPAVLAQNWDVPAEFAKVIAAVNALTEQVTLLRTQLSTDAETGKPASPFGPQLMLRGPDGIAVPAAGTKDGRLKVEMVTPVTP